VNCATASSVVSPVSRVFRFFSCVSVAFSLPTGAQAAWYHPLMESRGLSFIANEKGQSCMGK
jgi:hypothetical protein